MNVWESLRVALTALRANKMRSLLTMLGVIIGVSAVIVMISIVQGARQKVVADFRGDGADVLFAVYAPRRVEGRRKGGRFEGLRMDDVSTLQRRLPELTSVSPTVEQSLTLSRGGKKDYAASGKGVLPAYQEVETVHLVQGRFFEERDAASWEKVCIIGDDVRLALWNKEENPIGQSVIVTTNGMRLPLVVIGLLEHKGRSGFGDSPDKQILLPLTTFQKRLSGSDIIAQITARAGTVGAERAADAVFAVLKQRHPDHAQDFIVDTQEGLLQRLDSVLLILQLILGGVSGLSLLVGGIGIMNIMLVSVTERTREIGIRKAVGAKRRDILAQFITESITVSGVGGLAGVGLGYGTSKLIGLVAGESLQTFVPLWAAGLGFGFSVGVGMFFGIYPAFRAARLDPIDALRYE